MLSLKTATNISISTSAWLHVNHEIDKKFNQNTLRDVIEMSTDDDDDEDVSPPADFCVCMFGVEIFDLAII